MYNAVSKKKAEAKAEVVGDLKAKIRVKPWVDCSLLFCYSHLGPKYLRELKSSILEDSDYHYFDNTFYFGKLGDFDDWCRYELLLHAKEMHNKIEVKSENSNPR